MNQPQFQPSMNPNAQFSLPSYSAPSDGINVQYDDIPINQISFCEAFGTPFSAIGKLFSAIVWEGIRIIFGLLCIMTFPFIFIFIGLGFHSLGITLLSLEVISTRIFLLFELFMVVSYLCTIGVGILSLFYIFFFIYPHALRYSKVIMNSLNARKVQNPLEGYKYFSKSMLNDTLKLMLIFMLFNGIGSFIMYVIIMLCSCVPIIGYIFSIVFVCPFISGIILSFVCFALVFIANSKEENKLKGIEFAFSNTKIVFAMGFGICILFYVPFINMFTFWIALAGANVLVHKLNGLSSSYQQEKVINQNEDQSSTSTMPSYQPNNMNVIQQPVNMQVNTNMYQPQVLQQNQLQNNTDMYSYKF